MEEEQKALSQKYIESYFPQNVDSEELQNIINQSVKLKLIGYFVFLMTKLGLEKLNHRKIVHRIFSQYILKQKLEIDCYQLMDMDDNNYMVYFGSIMKQLSFGLQELNITMKDCWLGDNGESLKYLSEGLKQFSNLQRLQLDLSGSHFGVKTYDIRNLCDGFKFLLKLKYLNMNFYENNIGLNKYNMKYLGRGIFKYLQNLRHLELDLSYNSLGENVENLQNLGIMFKLLPDNLDYIQLNLCGNQLGERNNFRYLADSLKSLSKKLQGLDLMLWWNCYEGEGQNMKQFWVNIKQLPRELKDLRLSLCGNYLSENMNNARYLREGVKQLPKNLINLELDLTGNISDENKEYFMNQLGEGIKCIPQKLQLLNINLMCNNLGDDDLEKFKKDYCQDAEAQLEELIIDI